MSSLAVLKNVDHIAYVARDLDAGIEAVSRACGLAVEREADLPEFSLRSVMMGKSPVVIEVVQFLSPAIAKARLGELDMRVDHVAYEVESIERAAAQLAALGARFSGPDGVEVDKPIVFGSTKHLWTQPGATPLGFGLQLVERQTESTPSGGS